MPYFCEPCAYKCNKTSNYKKHLKSNKHLKNFQEFKEPKEPVEEKKKSESVHYACPKCNQTFTAKSSMNRHLNYRCPILREKLEQKKNEVGKTLEEQIAILGSQLGTQLSNQITSQFENMKKDFHGNSQVKSINTGVVDNSRVTNNTMNNTMNNTVNTINNTGNKTFLFLNQELGNMIDMDTFINNYQNDYKLDTEQTQRLLDSYQLNGLRSYSLCLSKTLKENCQKQLKDLGINIPDGLIPLVSTDTQLRSFKVKGENKWETCKSDSDLIKLIVISNDQVYNNHQFPIFIIGPDRAKVANYIKADNAIREVKKIITESKSEA